MSVRTKIALALASVMCGCASREAAGPSYFPPMIGNPLLNSALLFDRAPGALSAGLFAGRSDWPSVIRDVSTGDIEVYDVIIYDRQAGDPYYYGHGYDHFNRTFRSRRSGASFR